MSTTPILNCYFDGSVSGQFEEKHQHNVYQMIYVKKGSVAYDIIGDKNICRAPAVLFISNYESHSLFPVSREYERYITTINPHRIDSLLDAPILGSVFSMHSKDFSHHMDIGSFSREFDLLFDFFFRSVKENDTTQDSGMRIWLNALLELMYEHCPTYFSESSGHASMIVSRVRSELETNPKQRLNLDTLSKKYFISKYYLTHIFKKHTGYSLKEYQLLCRISYACDLLKNKDDSIMEIAAACGISDISNFSRYFKARMGITPSQYRNGVMPNHLQFDTISKSCNSQETEDTSSL